MAPATERRRVRRAVRSAVALGALAAALALGSSPVASAQDAPAPYRVAGIADVELFRGAEIGARARFEALNAAGGIDGRPVEFLGVGDDHRDATMGSAEVRRLVDEVGVDAVVPVVTSRFTDGGTLAEARVPAFGWGIAGGFCGNRWAFGITGCRAAVLPREQPTIWGTLVAQVVREGGERRPTAVVVTEASAVPGSLVQITELVRDAGFRVTSAHAVLESGESATAGVDATADAILAAGAKAPSAVFSVAGYSAVTALQDALKARGYAGVMTNLVQYSPALVASAAGAFVLTDFATPESAPENPRMQTILDQVAAVTSDPVTPSTLAGWFAADFWIRAVERAGPGASPAKVARTASKMRFRIPRTIGPTAFPKAFVRPSSCGQLVTSDGTTFSVAATYRCSGYVRLQNTEN